MLENPRFSTRAELAAARYSAALRYHIHGIPWYHGRGRREVVVVNLPLREGSLGERDGLMLEAG